MKNKLIYISLALIYAPSSLATTTSCFNLSNTAGDFSSIEFDYLVIGSGAGGLPVAFRLSEDENVKVGIIEAGYLHLNDPLIDMPGKTGLSLGNPEYDWSFVTTPQKNAMGRQVPQPRGKMLGGSTGLNYLGWDRASKLEYDAWSKFTGDDKYAEDWNYDALLPYFKRSESLVGESHDPVTVPSISSEEDSKKGEEESRYGSGYQGPIETAYYTFFSDITIPWLKSWLKLGIPVIRNAINGTTIGARVQRNSLQKSKGIRSYAVSGYLCPASQRRNLFVIQGAHATQILLSNSKDSNGNTKATGVVFSSNNLLYQAKVNPSGEVIVAAGALSTPQILEMSGIGNPEILGKYGITTKVDLPGVGENLIDQIFVPSQFKLKGGLVTFDNLKDPKFLAEQTALYNKNGSGALASGDCTVSFHPLKAFIPSSQTDTILSNLKKHIKKRRSTLTPLQNTQYAIMEDWLKKGNVPQAEVVLFSKGFINPTEGNSYMTMASGIQHPFSRGSVHIGSSDPLVPPLIDPNYLDFEYDMSVLVESTKLALRLAEQEPLAEIVAAKEFPPATSDKEIDGWARMTIITGSHPIGTTPMAPRSMGGVVDSSLKVYGTSNIRVADASILPISIAAHTQATVYAIGEKAADIIKCSKAAGEGSGVDDLLSRFLIQRH